MENEYIYVPWWFELPTNKEYKFIKLFEEYLVKYNSEYWPINCSINIPWITLMWIHESVIISEKFWFIDWLVKNDKIDFNFWFIYHTYDEDELGEKYSDLDSLIMYLSIQDNPIEYLCSILKQ